MSATTISNKIALGYAKVGRKIGYAFNVFRPDNFINPLDIRNKIFTSMISWSKDDKFKILPEPTLDFFTIYGDFRPLNVGDIINSDEQDRTFILADIDPIRGAVAVQATGFFDVQRTSYTTSSDIKTTLVPIIENMPGAIEFKNASQTDGALTGMNSKLKTSHSNIEIWTWLPANVVKINDILVLNSNKYNVISVDSSFTGLKIKAMSVKAGQ